ncbi:hypothetical protein [Microseira wollei]|nr:hypothetical protein [Microseira wollei]
MSLQHPKYYLQANILALPCPCNIPNDVSRATRNMSYRINI